MPKRALWMIPVLLFMVLLIGCQSEEGSEKEAESKPKQPPLTEAEKLAIEFAENYFVHYNVEKLRTFQYTDNVTAIESETNTVKPGKVKIASQISNSYQVNVTIFVPQHLCTQGNRIEIHLFKNSGSGSDYRIGHARLEGTPLPDFQKFQLTDYWQHEGKLMTWKDAELK